MERKYCPLPKFSMEEAKIILDSNNIEDLILLPLSAGTYFTNWKAAQDICIKLSAHADERVRANVALGLAYTARTKGKLEKHIVKPVLLKLLRECNEYRWRVLDAIGDINFFMHWHIGVKAISKISE